MNEAGTYDVTWNKADLAKCRTLFSNAESRKHSVLKQRGVLLERGKGIWGTGVSEDNIGANITEAHNIHV